MKPPKRIVIASFQSLTAQSGGGMARLGYYLSEVLHKKGLLKKFIVHSKGKFQTGFPSVPVSPSSRYYLYLLNKLNSMLPFQPHKFRFMQELIYDRMCAMQIDNQTDILFVTQPYLLHTFKKAKKKGIKIIFIPANPEENYIQQLVTEEKKLLGIGGTDSYTYKKRIDYYNRSMQYVDIVIGSYPTVYTTYRDSSFKGEVVELIGHLKPDVKPVVLSARDPEKKSFKVGYLAHTVVLKGLHYLLEAWKQLLQEHDIADITLHVAGKIDDSIRSYIGLHFKGLKQIEYIGHVPDITSFYKEMDLFVVPSLIDGGPYTALEAAHYTVPVLITENCGSAELLGRNEPGCWVVPIRDAAALKEKILFAFKHREVAIETGVNAKNNLEHYQMMDFIANLADYLESI